MNKPEIIKKIAEITGDTQKNTVKALDAFVQVVKDSLANGEDVNLIGFANFTVQDVEETTKRNPRTGEAILSPAHKKVHIKVSKCVKDYVNE